LLDRHDARLLALVVDDQDFADADAFVDTEIAGYNGPLEAGGA